ncbi:pentatricopeptide repeat-containing protein [Salix suchowensis]|nr:pentatricopeptide repeat-containing protein [Salix suchowensis]
MIWPGAMNGSITILSFVTFLLKDRDEVEEKRRWSFLRGILDVGAYGSHSHALRASELSGKIQQSNAKPDEVLMDLLGRAGRLKEAYHVLQNSTETREGCQFIKHTIFCMLFAQRFRTGRDQNREAVYREESIYSCCFIKNVSSARNWGRVRLKMKEPGRRKNPGYSWNEIDRRIQPFFVEDRSHPTADMVRQRLTIMEKDIKLPPAENM